MSRSRIREGDEAGNLLFQSSGRLLLGRVVPPHVLLTRLVDQSVALHLLSLAAMPRSLTSVCVGSIVPNFGSATTASDDSNGAAARKAVAADCGYIVGGPGQPSSVECGRRKKSRCQWARESLRQRGDLVGAAGQRRHPFAKDPFVIGLWYLCRVLASSVCSPKLVEPSFVFFLDFFSRWNSNTRDFQNAHDGRLYCHFDIDISRMLRSFPVHVTVTRDVSLWDPTGKFWFTFHLKRHWLPALRYELCDRSWPMVNSKRRSHFLFAMKGRSFLVWFE